MGDATLGENVNVGAGTITCNYDGVNKLMSFAKAVSAKSLEFDNDGNHITFDISRLMQIVIDNGYRGYVGIEYEGKLLSEDDGITLTKALLEQHQYNTST